MLNSVYYGGIHGIVAWVVYGVVECVFSTVLPVITQSNFHYTPWHWVFTALLLCFYSVIGLILGGLSGLGLCIASRRIPALQKVELAVFFPAMAVSTVLLVFATNLAFRFRLGVAVLTLLSVSLLLVLCLILSVRSSMWFRRLRFLTNPWTISIILLGLSWVILDLLENYSRPVKAVATLVYLAAVILISFLTQKGISMLPIGKSSPSTLVFPTRLYALLAVTLLVVLIFSFGSNRAPDSVAKSLKIPIPSVDHPNVLLIVMDTVRADYLSLYGYERDTTPNLLRFAEDATVYSHAIAPSDMTLSTHASIFTGMYARQHGAHFNTQGHGQPLADKFRTLAEILSEKGYLTMGVAANLVFFGNGFGLEQGFDYFDSRESLQYLILHSLGRTQKFFFKQAIHQLMISFVPHSEREVRYRKAEAINSEVFTLLDKMQLGGNRFFLFVNYMDAHWPYRPPSPFDTLYPGKDEKFTTSWHLDLLKEVVDKRARGITAEERRHLVSQYSGAITYLDFHLGRLLKRLKDLGFYDDCLIIITSDHGEAFGERDLIEHGVSVYQDQVHIPLIIKYPNVRQRQVVDTIVSVIDLMPTILDVLGYEIPRGIQGKSLLRLEPGKSKSVVSESYPNVSFLGSRFLRVEQAIFSGPYKFISSTSGKRELYDLSKDPNETNDLYKVQARIANDLELSLNNWLKTVVAETGSGEILDKEILDHLRSLGYLQ